MKVAPPTPPKKRPGAAAKTSKGLVMKKGGLVMKSGPMKRKRLQLDEDDMAMLLGDDEDIDFTAAMKSMPAKASSKRKK